MNEKPTKPDESECCGSGCKPCIFDVYEEKLKKWELKQTDFTQSRGLNQVKYLPFLITNIKNLTNSLKIFKFQAIVLKEENHDGVHVQNLNPTGDYEILKEFLLIKPGEYLILKGAYESDNERVIVSRSYTPVLAKEDFQDGSFTVIVSLIPDGKMSRFFNRLNVDDVVFWRGPYLEFTYRPNSFRHVLLFGGGTGAVPVYNISKSIVENEEDDTWVNVVCSFKTAESVILRKEFGSLSDYWNFKMSIHLTEASDFKSNYNESIIFKRMDEDVIKREVEKCGDEVLVVVCGPENFNQFVGDNLKKLGVKNQNIFIFW